MARTATVSRFANHSRPSFESPESQHHALPWRFRLLLVLVTAIGAVVVALGQDIFGSLSLTGRLAGGLYGAAGLVILACVLVLSGAVGWLPPPGSATWRSTVWVAAGAVTYVCTTLAVYSLAVQPLRAVVEAGACVVCLVGLVDFAGSTPSPPVGRTEHGIPAASSTSAGPGAGSQDIARPVAPTPSGAARAGRLAAAAGALLTAAQFWYTNVYLPSNADIGIGFDVAVQPPLWVSHQLRLVPVDITIDDASSSSATALVLGSMFVVDGVSYPTGALRWRSPSAELQAEPDIGLGRLTSDQANMVDIAPAPGATSAVSEQLLSIGHPAGDGRLLFPDIDQTTRMLVAVPRRVRALEVHVYLDYTRDSQLRLAGEDATTGKVGLPYAYYATGRCQPSHNALAARQQHAGQGDNKLHAAPRDVNLLEIRQLIESALQTVTKGPEVLVSYWCFAPGGERTASFVAPRPAGLRPTTGAAETDAPPAVLALAPGPANDYGIRHVQTVWTLPIR
jgi:hypothetical protein